MDNQQLRVIADAILDKKGEDVISIDLRPLGTAITDHFVICTGTSTMQVSAIADSVREYVQEHAGVKPYNYDGYQNSQWIVLDYGTIYVHVFLPEYRDLYKLEQLWSDAKITDIPDLD